MKKELLNRIKNLKFAIQNIEIQGASNVALASVKLILLFLRTLKNEKDFKIIEKKLFIFMNEIAHLRKTEPLTRNLVKYIKYKLSSKKFKDINNYKKYIKKYATEYEELLKKHKNKIAQYGKKLISENDNIFTHCHSSMVENILKEANKTIKFKVFNDETRPLYQGHITSERLLSYGIENTILVDSASSFFISKYSGEEFTINKVFLGTDAIALDGSCVNKIGSYGISLSAHKEKIPVYIASSLLKIDVEALSGDKIKIEERSAKEVWDNPPKNLNVINLAFDLVPKNYIKYYITEFGLIEAKYIRRTVKKEYPWIF